jgi:4-methylaminobutanoate oxidase (formaldehyde-forming)
MGPHARDTLQPITSVDLSNKNFSFGSISSLEIAGIKCQALRMSYVGELGWEIYVPVINAVNVFDEIMKSGSNYGICLAGYHAMNSLRLESGYRHWGHDITAADTPLEAGLAFAVAWDKPNGFVGKDSLITQRDEVRTKRLLQFRIEDQEILSYHDDPIFRDGELMGTTTGGMWSYTEDRCLTMGYTHSNDGVTKSWIDSGTWEIEVATRRLKVTPSIKSFYDPNKEKIRL